VTCGKKKPKAKPIRENRPRSRQGAGPWFLSRPLGTPDWADIERARRMASRMLAGRVAINGMLDDPDARAVLE